jgi:CarD family transcriptional regulator
MLNIGDLVVYGNNGVCKISDITKRARWGTESASPYYVMTPLYQNCTIFSPVNANKVFMRPIITRKEADRLINMIPAIQVEDYNNQSLNRLAEHYRAFFETHDCAELLKLCMSIYAKKKRMEQQGRKFGAVDEKYMKRAEDLLFGELAAALDIEKEQVRGYIKKRIHEEPGTNDPA